MSLFQLDTFLVLLFFMAFIFLGWAIYLSHKENDLVTKFLFLGAFFLGLFYTELDPFLHLWDEQFHALVAKNLGNNFLSPKLYTTPSLPLDYRCWTDNEIWLHKQPLFLWQMALSINVFGPTTFAVRLPSLIMHALIPLLIYEIGAITWNKKIGFYGALLFTVSSYPLELVAGKYATDHNDIAFLFYTTASFWAWFRYEKENKWYWLVLIGIFSGFAVLIKWLIGLLIFVIWGIVKLSTKQSELFNVKSFFPLLLSFSISLVILLPWQIYSFYQFSIEATHEFVYNSKHLYEVIEGHGGDWTFHLTKGFKKLYGDGFIVPFLVSIAIVLSIIKLKVLKYKIFFSSLIMLIYFFFSIVATKMISYPLIVFPFVCLIIGFLINYVSNQIKKNRLKVITTFTILLALCFSAFNFKALHHHHIKNRKLDELNLVGEFAELKMIETLDHYLLQEDYILFNSSITPYGHIATMFFTKYESYSFIPSEKQLQLLKNKHCKIACLNTGNLPLYILDDESIRLVPLP